MNSRILVSVLCLAGAACAHEGHGVDPQNEYAVRRARQLNKKPTLIVSYSAPMPAAAPVIAKAFDAFAPRVQTRWDENFLYVESDGLPAHNMMVGITAWQQQVPLPQSYRGDNAWRIPLNPQPAAQPASIKGRFLRGAIALAANGIPIFNPQNNRGEISQEIGELDQWGGHCGRADDYHYHIVPLHLQSAVGKGLPVAFALDGYPIFGLTEPDGSPVGKLDECHGHDIGSGYHYHAATKYPYVFAAFHGQVVEREGQVDPQPRAQPVRPALQALRGAKITGFETKDGSSTLSYTVGGEQRAVVFSVNADGSVPFEFQNGREGTVRQTYSRMQRGGGERTRDETPAPRNSGNVPAIPPSPKSEFVLKSPAVTDGGNLPVAFTGDGDGISPPLGWTGAPAGTKSFALIMHHLDPEGRTKVYWTLHDIPATTTQLAKNSKGIGVPGLNTIHGDAAYAPPHSKGPGAKTYVITVFALATPKLELSERAPVDALYAAIKPHILAAADLKVVYTRSGSSSADQKP